MNIGALRIPAKIPGRTPWKTMKCHTYDDAVSQRYSANDEGRRTNFFSETRKQDADAKSSDANPHPSLDPLRMRSEEDRPR